MQGVAKPIIPVCEANRETNYQKSSKEIKKDVNKTIKEKRHNKTDV